MIEMSIRGAGPLWTTQQAAKFLAVFTRFVGRTSLTKKQGWSEINQHFLPYKKEKKVAAFSLMLLWNISYPPWNWRENPWNSMFGRWKFLLGTHPARCYVTCTCFSRGTEEHQAEVLPSPPPEALAGLWKVNPSSMKKMIVMGEYGICIYLYIQHTHITYMYVCIYIFIYRWSIGILNSSPCVV